jgi:hypothetical protein
MMGV